MAIAMTSKLGRKARLLVAVAVPAAFGLSLPQTGPELNETGKAAPTVAQYSTPVTAKPAYTANGELIRPEGYREWIYVGTPLTPNDLNPPRSPLHEFHNVYIHPSDYDHWKETGAFPDGTVIVAETVSVGSKSATSGKGYFMGEFVGLEAAVKDSKRFKDEPGNWAYFSFGQTYPLNESSEKFPAASCNLCHRVSAAEDFVFTQYYPVLRAARKMGNNLPDGGGPR